jgi:hypothetical protein
MVMKNNATISKSQLRLDTKEKQFDEYRASLTTMERVTFLYLRQYSFKFMPFGFFGRLMVRLFNMMHHDDQVLRPWKYGCIIETERGEKLLLEYDAEKYVLDVILGSVHPRPLFLHDVINVRVLDFALLTNAHCSVLTR